MKRVLNAVAVMVVSLLAIAPAEAQQTGSWKERVVEKTAEKHAVSVAEAEEALLSRPVVRKMAKGRVHGEDVYAALAQTSSGR